MKLSGFILIMTTQVAIAQNWSGTSTPTTTADYNTQIRLTHIGWGSHHGILFNANLKNPLSDGTLLDNGNVQHAYPVGPYSSGAGAIMFLGNGGRMDFLVSGTSTGAGQSVDWGGPKLTIQRSGNIGIGTYDPTDRLQIFSSTFNRISATVNADVQNGFLINKIGTNATHWEMYTPAGNTDLRFYHSSVGDILNLRGDGTILANSMVGIGPVPSMASRLNIADGNGGEQLRISRGTGTVRFAQDINTDNLYLYNKNASLNFMTWRENGYVGVGTENPDAKLTVKGTVHAQEVKVDLNGAVAPDYVFEPDYKLTTLEEIKTYIAQHKHLPEIPSAKEMETNGLDLGAMNLLLLKKIEELTLHVIELKSENESMKRANATQDEQIRQLLKRQ